MKRKALLKLLDDISRPSVLKVSLFIAFLVISALLLGYLMANTHPDGEMTGSPAPLWAFGVFYWPLLLSFNVMERVDYVPIVGGISVIASWIWTYFLACLVVEGFNAAVGRRNIFRGRLG